eukprot:TRINITY_DN17433_c0_g1_i1.p3 TRINITY_DN17433_c0_g1~~TRINITY_DN17433_c0_g1_i1.p3  ORF type:complete len:131 (+),score=31.09 TRINITY_DN17433_c0_g1_i1:102-494(+)
MAVVAPAPALPAAAADTRQWTFFRNGQPAGAAAAPTGGCAAVRLCAAGGSCATELAPSGGRAGAVQRAAATLASRQGWVGHAPAMLTMKLLSRIENGGQGARAGTVHLPGGGGGRAPPSVSYSIQRCAAL